MILQVRELAIMTGAGVTMGFAAVALSGHAGISEDATHADGAPSSLQHAARQVQWDAKLQELQQSEGAPSTPAQEWAQAVLESGQPLTVREMSTLSQILNGSSSQTPGYPGVAGSTFGDGSAASALPARSQGGNPLDQLSASGAWLEQQRGTERQSDDLPATTSMGGGSGTNVGALDTSGRYYAPAGPGAYVSTQDGTYFAPAGPNGVIDTRTGAFIPTTP